MPNAPTPAPERAVRRLNRYSKLSWQQLFGADYAFRVLFTSPVFRGRSFEILQDQMAELREEAQTRPEAKKEAPQ